MENLGRFRNGNLERELTALQSKMDQKMGELEVSHFDINEVICLILWTSLKVSWKPVKFMVKKGLTLFSLGYLKFPNNYTVKSLKLSLIFKCLGWRIEYL